MYPDRALAGLLRNRLPLVSPTSALLCARLQATRRWYGQSSSERSASDCGSNSSAVSFTGEEITYCPLAHLPRSMVRQRSLQKGKSASPFLTGFLQIGQRNWAALATAVTRRIRNNLTNETQCSCFEAAPKEALVRKELKEDRQRQDRSCQGPLAKRRKVASADTSYALANANSTAISGLHSMRWRWIWL